MKRKITIETIFISFLLSLSFCLSAQAGGWSITQLEQDPTPGNDIYGISMARDSSDNAHIIYTSWSNAYLHYITNASGSWVVTSIDNDIYASGYMGNSIAVDSNNFVHIVYRANSGKVWYATNATGSWVTSSTTLSSAAGRSISVAVDSNNNIHVIYSIGNQLWYITKPALVGSPWSAPQNVDLNPSADLGFYNSMVIDKTDNNRIHIAYYDKTNQQLMYATKLPADPSFSATAVAVGGLGPSIAIDSNHKVHISHCDATGATWMVKYTTNSPIGNWSTILVDPGLYTTASAISVDSNNNVHISYLLMAGAWWLNYQKYATNASGPWVNSTVDSGSGYNCPIDLSSDNRPRISYPSPPNLMYAELAACVDIGLRVADNLGNPVKICAEPLGTLTSPLRIADKNGVARGIVLVGTGDADASPLRIQTNLGGMKALKKMP